MIDEFLKRCEERGLRRPTPHHLVVCKIASCFESEFRGEEIYAAATEQLMNPPLRVTVFRALNRMVDVELLDLIDPVELVYGRCKE